MEDCNSSKYTMEAKLQLGKDVEGSLVDPKEYRRIIECLRYLTHTRPDISYVVDIASRYMEKHTTLHQHAVNYILRYVKGTKNYGIQLRRGREVEELVGFTDSDLAGDTDDRKIYDSYYIVVPRTLAKKLVERGKREPDGRCDVHAGKRVQCAGVSVYHTVIRRQIHETYEVDPNLAKIIPEIRVNADSHSKYSYDHGMLSKRYRLEVEKNNKLRTNLIAAMHLGVEE
ncbi:uncharacterized protein LOC124943301 [Impatiens glandulifera]|uniref:uncharacterized protein LOC124943301 n=1 Tax=Impatiens glandulifera TaxID=253017 RepID=UPI001FB07F20|nr:uncharacterized protein LOC124943301 [Impatiens glandulifera]